MVQSNTRPSSGTDTAQLAEASKGDVAPEILATGEFPIPPSGRLTAREKKWIVYDIGNSAFVLLTTSVTPIYVDSLLKAARQDNAVSAWGYAQTIAALVVAVLMPILGSIADVEGMKIKFFIGFTFTGIIACFAMALPLGWLAFLLMYIIARIGFNGSLTFYDSMLIDTTNNERMDKVSAWGYALGYVGSTLPFIGCLALIFTGPSLLGLSAQLCTQISFAITALWWVAFTVPLLQSFKQRHYRLPADRVGEAVRGAFSELAGTCKSIAKNKPLLMYMIAFFFYIDAVNTVISMSTSYGAQLGIDATQLVLALLVTQFVAFPFAILYGRLASKVGSKFMITVSVVAYLGIVMFAAFFMRQAVHFWILAVLVGMFMGGIQALSRSYYGKLIPKERANEYYGFYDIFGKSASVLGTLLVAAITDATGNASLGVLSIGILLIFALVFLLLQKDPTKQASAQPV